MRTLFCAVALIFPVLSLAQIWPATVPLAVRNPYFNAHINLAGSTHNDWPQFWNLSHILAWDLWVMVDKQSMQLFGGSGNTTNLTNIEITPTRSILTLQAGPVDATVTFLNPIVPGDLVAQSLPFTYMYCDITVTDGKEHSIQLYTDVTGEWLSNDIEQPIEWDIFKSSIIYHNVWLKTRQSLTEKEGMALDASLYYASRAGDGVAYRASGADGPGGAREQWKSTATLDGGENKTFRNIKDDWPCFAFSRDYGMISDKTETAVWTLGLVRDPTIKFGTTERHPYYLSQYKDAPDALTQFLANFENAQAAAVSFDTAFTDAAKKISDDYAQLVSIGGRQALATIEWTVSQSDDGSWNTSDSMAFMKDIGVSTRVSPVNVMSATFPMLLSINATWAGYLLQPLLYSAKQDGSSLEYAIYDLGNQYPNASAQSTPPKHISIESSGDMLMMTWAQATVSGDATYIKSYYSVMKKWADYLVSEVTFVQSGMTDGDNISNANLALKGILGVKCMAAIAKAVGQNSDSSVYSANATALYNSWKGNAFKDNHVVSDYSASSTWGLVYALYYDHFLDLKVVEEEVYSAQDTFYASKLANADKFGVAYDSVGTGDVSAPWNMLTSAATTDTDVRDTLISQVYARMATNASSGVFPSTYDSSKGDIKPGSGTAGAGIGAMWSILSLNLELKTPSGGGALDGSTSTSNDKESGSSAGPIAGGVVGGLAVLGAAAAFIFLWRRRLQRNHPVYEARPEVGSGILPLPVMCASSQRTMVEPYRVEPFTIASPTTGISSVSWSGPRSDGSSSSGRNTTHGGPAALHAEVENLRREMEVMRAQVQYSHQDMPPPSYDMERGRMESGLSTPPVHGTSSAVNVGAGMSGQSGSSPPPVGAASPYLHEKTGN